MAGGASDLPVGAKAGVKKELPPQCNRRRLIRHGIRGVRRQRRQGIQRQRTQRRQLRLRPLRVAVEPGRNQGGGQHEEDGGGGGERRFAHQLSNR